MKGIILATDIRVRPVEDALDDSLKNWVPER